MKIRVILPVIFLSVSQLISAQILLSHNDYEQDVPLHYSLDREFDIIEADVYLRNGVIVVCHDEDEIEDAPTLVDLYIVPLSKMRSEKVKGKILMLDIKSEDPNIIDEIEILRKNHPEVFDHMDILLSGNLDRKKIAHDVNFDNLLIDGRLSNLTEEISSVQMPIISMKINDVCNWKGCKRISKKQAQKIKTVVDQVHDTGRQIRFWNVDDNPQAWNVLKVLGVDIIGVDDLDKYMKYRKSSSTD